ncbi:MAG: hypothetical protein SGPRY_013857, partial [Prymnesium sp.]
MRLRREFSAAKSGGMRDVLRAKLEQHYDAHLRHFQRTFVVAGISGMCERAYAVAAGVSEVTYVRARTDVTKERPMHAGRVQVRQTKESAARQTLDAWVRSQRDGMEGNKTTGKKWYTEKVTEKQLWLRYTKSCDRAQQPTVGSSRLLFDIWKSHDEIVVVKPTGHAICDVCSDIHAARLALEGMPNQDAKQRRSMLDAEAEARKEYHTTERRYYDDSMALATYHAELMTCITIDAPTQHQFDLPSQARWKRDTSKKLDGARRWQSKVEGVLDAGVGMMAFVARIALGGGANLVATVLILTLVKHVEIGRPLGAKLHLQLDNTTAENKNKTLLGTVALLVAWQVFEEATIFYLPVGHTYNELDAAFSPLITALLRRVIETMTGLLEFIQE